MSIYTKLLLNAPLETFRFPQIWSSHHSASPTYRSTSPLSFPLRSPTPTIKHIEKGQDMQPLQTGCIALTFRFSRKVPFRPYDFCSEVSCQSSRYCRLFAPFFPPTFPTPISAHVRVPCMPYTQTVLISQQKNPATPCKTRHCGKYARLDSNQRPSESESDTLSN